MTVHYSGINRKLPPRTKEQLEYMKLLERLLVKHRAVDLSDAEVLTFLARCLQYSITVSPKRKLIRLKMMEGSS